MIRAAIVGLGKMGILHAGILNALPNSSVVAFCEKETLLNKFAKKMISTAKFYDNLPQMINEESPDLVYIATPIISHAQIFEDVLALRPSTRIFVEKPLATNCREARKMIEIAGSARGLHMIGFQKRFSRIFQKGKELIDNGAMGELQFFRAYSFVSGVFSDGKGWRFQRGQGGAMLDLGCHLLDLLLWYFGRPAKIKALERSFYGHEVEDYSHAMLGFPSGLTGYFDVSWSMQGYRLPETKIEVFGSNGSLTISDDYLQYEIFSDVSSIAQSGKHFFQKPEFETSVKFLIGDPEYCFEDEYFVKCAETGENPEPGLESGATVNQIIEQIHASSQEMLETVRVS